MRTRLWKVTVSNDSIYLGLMEDSRPDYVKEQKGEGNDIVAVEYLAISSSSATAVKKAILEYRRDRMSGHDLKFQFTLYISIEKMINRPGVIEAWPGKVLK
jgi:hypothetical protein